MNFSRSFWTLVCCAAFSTNSTAQVKRAPGLVAFDQRARVGNLSRDKVCVVSPDSLGTANAEREGRKLKRAERQKAEEIIAAARARTAALIARDANQLRGLLARDFLYTNASGKVLDRDAYIQNYALEKSVSWTSQTLSDVCVRFSSGVAVLTAITHDVASFGEYRLDARFRTTQIYRRSAKGWIYLAGHTSTID